MLTITRDSKTGDQLITFSLDAGHDGGAISVVGNFNDWTPGATPLTARGTSQSASIAVPADYITVFRYLGENDYWFDEPDATFVDSGASVLVPRSAGSEEEAGDPSAAPVTKRAPRRAARKGVPTGDATEAPQRAATKPTKESRAAKKPAQETEAAKKPAKETESAKKPETQAETPRKGARKPAAKKVTERVADVVSDVVEVVEEKVTPKKAARRTAKKSTTT